MDDENALHADSWKHEQAIRDSSGILYLTTCSVYSSFRVIASHNKQLVQEAFCLNLFRHLIPRKRALYLEENQESP
jgi:hypothetical protein